MKTLVYLLLCLSLTTGFAQEKYLTKTGTLEFEASVPSFEEVAAKNTSVTAILNADNGEFASLALVKGFRFKNALMEEHFNENYAESSEFPKATFKGTFKDFDKNSLSGKQQFTIDGELIFHGVTNTLKDIPVTIEKQGDQLVLTGSFVVLISDYNIKIPSIVENKISKDVKVSFNFTLDKK
ncbi:YceI family protein [Mangrovimonas sp. YM274]|uniref:YceI family protein n=1 Tax=Mangrovimonas sp. YM274 TaxID=3070660 RepID=UPI0027DCB120|nr:YceI family protein [Mangrovimonas sp. YM274]WMI68675.1 YceI family protein [Mangrovimonas sp. YM274]